MAKQSKTTSTGSLSSQELKDLQSLGYVEGNAATIPDNISPVLKSKILEGINAENGNVNSQDLGSATERQNQLVRERAAADGDEDMQKVLDDQQANSQAVQQKNAEDLGAQQAKSAGVTAQNGVKK